MARGQQQGAGAITVWMIIFVALWLTSTVFLVVLYTGQEELHTQINSLQADKDKLISPDEQRSVELVRNARSRAEGGPTVVGILEGERKKMAALATGTETDDVETARRRFEQFASTIEGDNIVPNADEYPGGAILGNMEALYDAFKAEHALRTEADGRVGQLDTEVGKLVELNAQQKSDFETRVGELTDQLAQLEADHKAYRTERDEAVARMEQDFESSRTQAVADLTAERQRVASLERDLRELRQRFVDQQEKFGELMIGPAELVTARQPDGQILTAVPGDDVVYVNLGSENQLTLGLQFSVYSASTGIPASGYSKAQIEVVSIDRSSAECKIVRLEPNQVVLEGDLIANPVYDPKRRLVFLTIGGFDLDYDGTVDPDGRAAIESIVADWGGETTNELTAMTDFVVAGAAPRRPRAATGDTEVRGDQAAWQSYMDTLTSARNLSVPVMSQDVFLNFLGYSGRTAQR